MKLIKYIKKKLAHWLKDELKRELKDEVGNKCKLCTPFLPPPQPISEKKFEMFILQSKIDVPIYEYYRIGHIDFFRQQMAKEIANKAIKYIMFYQRDPSPIEPYIRLEAELKLYKPKNHDSN